MYSAEICLVVVGVLRQQRLVVVLKVVIVVMIGARYDSARFMATVDVCRTVRGNRRRRGRARRRQDGVSPYFECHHSVILYD